MLYADDLKLSKDINCIDNKLELQANTDAVLEWSKVWLLPLNIEKLSYLHIKHVLQTTYMCVMLSKLKCRLV